MATASQSNAVRNAVVSKFPTTLNVRVNDFPMANDLYTLMYVRSTGAFGGFGGVFGVPYTPPPPDVSHAITVFEKMGGLKFSWSFNANDEKLPPFNMFQIYSRTPQDVERDVEKVLAWKHILLDIVEFDMEELLGAPIGKIDFDKLSEQPNHVAVQILKAF